MTTPTDAQVNIYARDPEVLAAFYKGLGLHERFRFPTDGEPDQVEVSVGGLTLGFTSRRAIESLAGLPVEPGPAQAEVVLWCKDTTALWNKALELGARPLAPPKVFNDRLVAAWVADPEANRVKIVCLVNRSSSE